jgi:hypothetical protein
VNECIGLAVIPLDEAEAFHRIEKLDCPLSFLAGQLALRSAIGTTLDRHRLALNPEVRRRDPAAAIHKRELKRLTVGKVGEARLLDCGDVDEYVVATVIADDEAESLLRIEELHDALALADNLGRHSSTTAAAESAAAAGAAAGEAAATTISAKAATVAISAIAPEAAAFFESAAVAVAVLEEPVALVPAATATVAFTPSIETHARQNSLCPNQLEPTRWAATAQPVSGAFCSRTVHSLT